MNPNFLEIHELRRFLNSFPAKHTVAVQKPSRHFATLVGGRKLVLKTNSSTFTFISFLNSFPAIPQGYFLRSPSRLPSVCTLCAFGGDENTPIRNFLSVTVSFTVFKLIPYEVKRSTPLWGKPTGQLR